MRQLTSLDAQFLGVETSRTYGHVGGLAVYDPSTAPGGTLEIGDVCRMVVRAAAHAAAVPLAAGRGAVRDRPAVLGRGPGLRPRLPHPRERGAAAGRRPPAGGDRRADLRAPARPLAAAVGAVPDPGARGPSGPRGDADQAAPLDGRRRVGQRDPRRAARPEPRGQGAAAEAGGRAGRARPRRPRDARPRAARRAAPAAAGAALAAVRAAEPDRPPRRQRLPGRAAAGERALARPRRRPDGARGDHRPPAEDELQRPRRAAPPLRVRLALARHGQAPQERARDHGQRRRRRAVRRPRCAAGCSSATSCPTSRWWR